MSYQGLAPVYAKSDNKATVRVDPITGQMPADQLIIGSNNNGLVRPVTRSNAATIANALLPKNGILSLYLAGVQAITLASPIAVVDDGKTMLIISETAQAHTVTYSGGFGGAGTGKDVATFAAIGDYLRIVAINGKWYVEGTNTTIA